jgi:cell division protein FtsN
VSELPEPDVRTGALSTWEVDGSIVTSAEIKEKPDGRYIWIADRREGDHYVVAGSYATRKEAERHAALLFITGTWSFK